MILRSEMREEFRERKENHAVRGQERDGTSGKLEFLRGRRREAVAKQDYEERVTYRTITRTEFQKRRASFESHDEVEGDGREDRGGNERMKKTLPKKTRSMDELIPKEEKDPYRIQFQEKEMTEKLEDIHRMIVDMQEMTKQLKNRNFFPVEKDSGKLLVKSSGMISPSEVVFPAKENQLTGQSMLKSNLGPTVKSVRYRSTILIPIGSKWLRFKEEIELNIDSQYFR